MTTTIDHESAIKSAAAKVEAILRSAQTPVGSYYSDMLGGLEESQASLRRAISRARKDGVSSRVLDLISDCEPLGDAIDSTMIFDR